jgi:acyl-CoA dehydrogenase
MRSSTKTQGRSSATSTTTTAALRSLLARVLPAEVLAAVEPELREMGELSGGELYRLQLADRLNEPRLTQWDAWGERIDRDRADAAVAAGRADRGGARPGRHRLRAAARRPRASHVQFALAYLFTRPPTSTACPLAMTDGAARTLLDSGNEALIERAVPRLTSRDPAQFWTSGQWMTETTGGSDVGALRDRRAARRTGRWRLYGTQVVHLRGASQVALTLARPEGNGARRPRASRSSTSRRATPTAGSGIRVTGSRTSSARASCRPPSWILDGTPATRSAGSATACAQIVPMLNLTRTWNAVCAVLVHAPRRWRWRATTPAAASPSAAAGGAPAARRHAGRLQAEYRGALHLTFRWPS